MTEQINEPEGTTALATVDATPAGIMEAIKIADYSQFLYNANMGDKPVTDFTSEGIKTIALQYGISTGTVEIQFLDDGNAAIFTCTATHQNGQTAKGEAEQSEFAEWDVELWHQFADELRSDDFTQRSLTESPRKIQNIAGMLRFRKENDRYVDSPCESHCYRFRRCHRLGNPLCYT